MSMSKRPAGPRARRALSSAGRRSGAKSTGRRLRTAGVMALSLLLAVGVLGWVRVADRLFGLDTPTAAGSNNHGHEHAAAALPASLRTVVGPLTAASEGVSGFVEAQVAGDAGDVGDGGIPVGQKTVLTFRLTDPATGAPLTGLTPKADLRPNTPRQANPYALPEPDDPFDARETFVLVGDAGDIGVIEPGDDQSGHSHRPGLSLTRLTGSTFAGVVKLPGPSSEMVTDRTGRYVFASLPEENHVAVVDTLTRRILHTVDVGKEPEQLAVEPSGIRVWVANDGDGTVTAINAETHVPQTVSVGVGHHAIAFSADSRLVFVSNSESDTVSVVDPVASVGVADVPVGRNPQAMAVAGDRLYVANARSGTVSVLRITDERLTPEAVIHAGSGTSQVAIHPSGQVGVASNREANTLTVFDAQTYAVLKTVPAGRAPDGIAFLEDYALVRNIASPDITFVNLTNPDVADEIPIGSEPVLETAQAGVHAGLVVSGAGDDVLVPSPVEGSLHHIHVMMGRPMDMTQTPVDRGSQVVVAPAGVVRELTPGAYQRVVRFDRAGSYTLDISPAPERPSISFQLQVVASEVVRPWLVAPEKAAVAYVAGEESQVRFQVSRAGGEPEDAATDGVITVYRVEPGQGIWQRVQRAEPLGGGVYQTRVNFPAAGVFHATFTSMRLGLGADAGSAADLEVVQR